MKDQTLVGRLSLLVTIGLDKCLSPLFSGNRTRLMVFEGGDCNIIIAIPFYFDIIYMSMSKKYKLFFSTLNIPIDFIMLVLAGLFVYYLRFNLLSSTLEIVYKIPFLEYLIYISGIALAWVIVFVLSGLYSLEKRRFSKEFLKIFWACTIGTMLIIFTFFLARKPFSSRFIILASWGISFIFVSLGRAIIHAVELFCYKRNIGLEPVVLVGNSKSCQEIAFYIKNHKGLGYKLINTYKTVEKAINKLKNNPGKVRHIILGDTDIAKSKMYKLLSFCNEHQISFRYLTDTFDAMYENVKIDTLAGLPIVLIGKTALSGWGKVLKRFVDIIGAILGIILLSPFFIFIPILILLDSKGPVFVKLKRVGKRGKAFNLYKFRSMVKNAHQMKKKLKDLNERKGPLFKMKNDPRITKIGKYLRKTSLDEIPQFINVLKGEMSLVGPRPHEPGEVARYKKQHKQLLTIAPGITGLAQISGRSTLSFEEEAKLDIYYIENWSIWQDISIMIKTIPVVLLRKDVA